jgi:hypothetical protein
MHPDRQVRIGLRSVPPGELFNKLSSRYPVGITSIGDQSMVMDMLHAISHASHYHTTAAGRPTPIAMYVVSVLMRVITSIFDLVVRYRCRFLRGIHGPRTGPQPRS